MIADNSGSVAIGYGAVATGTNSIAIGVSAVAGPYRTPIQWLYIRILKQKHLIRKCKRKGNTITIETVLSGGDRDMLYPFDHKLEPQNDME
jgi:hypothetical protein